MALLSSETIASNDKMWKKVVVAELRNYPFTCMEGVRKTTHNLSQDGWYTGRDLNTGALKYEAECSPLNHKFR
jgi:hypothetical protein